MTTLAALAVAGCASGPPVYRYSTDAPLLGTTPFFPQELHQCGPAALATVLVQSGVATDPAALSDQVYLPGRHGSLQVELMAAARRLGRVPYRVAPTIESLARELAAGHPVLLLQNLALPAWPRWHYAVLIGLDERYATLRSGARRELRVNLARFHRQWRYGDFWGFVALRPGELPGDADARRWLEAYAPFEETGAIPTALLGYQRGTAHWPDDARLWLALGNARYGLHELPAAETAYREAVRRAPTLAAGWNNLAQVLGERGCRKLALAALDQAGTPADAALAAMLGATRAALPAADRPDCTP